MINYNSIGPAVDISTAIISTNDNDVFRKVLFECLEDEDTRHRIEFEVFAVDPEIGSRVDGLEGEPRVLPTGTCHTFQWRLEEACGEDGDLEFDLIEGDEAFDPLDLIENLPEEVQVKAKAVISAWLAEDYLAMAPEIAA